MPFHLLPVRDADIQSAFWGRLQRRARHTTIPAIFEAQKTHDHWPCLTWKEGHSVCPHQFWDSDIYKAVEAACWSMIRFPDAPMMETVEEAVTMIRSAQYADGYINSFYTVKGVDKRWTNLRDDHELYCMGHLLEAAVAYETLTGSGRLSDVASKICQHLDAHFGTETGKKRGYPGHQEIELGLLRWYEYSRDPVALKLARYFILERGRRDEKDELYYDHEARARGGDPYDFMGPEMKAWYHEPRDYAYQQADVPLTSASSVVGHSVRAMYYYTAATDLVRLTERDDEELAPIKTALGRLWRDLIDTKLYVTGGMGSDRQSEGFSISYHLPDLGDEGCYAETCATFALVNWCSRLLQLELRSEYADAMETALYNGFLGAVSADGDAFYYQNVLRTTAGRPRERSKWFGVACCPPNVAKLLANLSSTICSSDPQRKLIAIHQWIESDIQFAEMDTSLRIRTDMPWEGKAVLSVGKSCRMALRVPAWADKWTCSLAGEVVDGYFYVDAPANTDISVEFPIRPRLAFTNRKTGRDDICIMRGPLVYCLEDVDNPDVDIDLVKLFDAEPHDGEKIAVSAEKSVQTVVVRASQGGKADECKDSLYPSRPSRADAGTRSLVAIPYFLRANRGGNGSMRVWAPRA